MTMREVAELQAYWNISPWGQMIDDLRAARICASSANFSSAVDWKKRGSKPFQPKDFMPEYKRQAKPNPKEIAERVKLIKLAHSIKDGKHGGPGNPKH